MPYKLRKAPKKALYWVVTTETGKKHSKLPIPMDKAKAQMRILESALKGNGIVGDICKAFGNCFGNKSRRTTSLISPSSDSSDSSESPRSPRSPMTPTERVILESFLKGDPTHREEAIQLQRQISPGKDFLGNTLAPPGPNAKAVRKALFGGGKVAQKKLRDLQKDYLKVLAQIEHEFQNLVNYAIAEDIETMDTLDLPISEKYKSLKATKARIEEEHKKWLSIERKEAQDAIPEEEENEPAEAASSGISAVRMLRKKMSGKGIFKDELSAKLSPFDWRVQKIVYDHYAPQLDEIKSGVNILKGRFFRDEAKRQQKRDIIEAAVADAIELKETMNRERVDRNQEEYRRLPYKKVPKGTEDPITLKPIGSHGEPISVITEFPEEQNFRPREFYFDSPTLKTWEHQQVRQGRTPSNPLTNLPYDSRQRRHYKAQDPERKPVQEWNEMENGWMFPLIPKPGREKFESAPPPSPAGELDGEGKCRKCGLRRR